MCVQFLEHVALYGVRTMRWSFDTVTRYNEDKMTEKQWLRRILFLEAIAGEHSAAHMSTFASCNRILQCMIVHNSAAGGEWMLLHLEPGGSDAWIDVILCGLW